ncbi:hypothetical protein QFC21_004842 [Naganishia friedmannii]|uniref:Uncharacterized protein n=1 Tax=Naganishia friedmannii TaxID=89922 RepID=A0ACC2VDM4_9TREE|nr:hypothetical protein QFC21_004842 [Naganishia friedmannii]
MAAKQGYKYVIEHMEEDDDTTKVVPPWVQLEYAQMLKHAGPHSQVLFTSLSSASAEILPKQLKDAVAKHGTPVAEAHATTTPILQLLSSATPPIPISKVCLLDPKAERVLSPEDGEEGVFEYFLFGGILGDDPPRDRTGELRRMGFETRHLGSVQMTTDTCQAVMRRRIHRERKQERGESERDDRVSVLLTSVPNLEYGGRRRCSTYLSGMRSAMEQQTGISSLPWLAEILGVAVRHALQDKQRFPFSVSLNTNGAVYSNAASFERGSSAASALGVSKLIIDDKIPLDKIPYVDHPTIRFTENEAVEMPFRYIKGEDGEPILPAGMRELLRDDLNKSFDEF